MKKIVDVLIIGGGLAGASLLTALKQHAIDAVLIDARPLSIQTQTGLDVRSLALAPASVNIFKALDIWSALVQHATPIETIHVSMKGAFGATRLRGTAEKPLGFIVPLHHIAAAIHQHLPAASCYTPATFHELDDERHIVQVDYQGQRIEVHARCIVVADGGRTRLRERMGLPIEVADFHQQALTANILLTRSHEGIAYERFTVDGPIAMLPLHNKMVSMVWCMSNRAVKELAELPEKAFLERLQAQFGYRLGRFVGVGTRHVFPVTQTVMPDCVKWPFVFIGNAAHTLHPVAGQGFNLALRDVAMLTECFVRHGVGEAALAAYQQLRQTDHHYISQLTYHLIRGFGMRYPGSLLLKGFGLMAVDQCDGLKSLLGRYARGFGGVVPDMACGS